MNINNLPKWAFETTSLNLAGISFQGVHATHVAMLPHSRPMLPNEKIVNHQPSLTEWEAILAKSTGQNLWLSTVEARLESDNFALFQQQIWLRDGLRCAYCKAEMANTPLSLDFFFPDRKDPDNCLTICRPCQVIKGEMHPLVWCELTDLWFDDYVAWLAGELISLPPYPLQMKG